MVIEDEISFQMMKIRSNIKSKKKAKSKKRKNNKFIKIIYFTC